MHSSLASKQYVGTWVSESDLPQTVKFIKSALQLRHSLKCNKLRRHHCSFGHSPSIMNCLPVQRLQLFVFLVTKVSYNIALKCTIFYILTINFIVTVCVHYRYFWGHSYRKLWILFADPGLWYGFGGTTGKSEWGIPPFPSRTGLW